MSAPVELDPYALFEALERHRVSYVVIGGFARVVHGTGELTRGLDIVPSLRDENLRHLGEALQELGADPAPLVTLQSADVAQVAPLRVATSAGPLTIVAAPWGTRGYDDFRIRANRENLGRSLRPKIASLADLARTLEASARPEDAERLYRLRRMMELERRRSRSRGLHVER